MNVSEKRERAKVHNVQTPCKAVSLAGAGSGPLLAQTPGKPLTQLCGHEIAEARESRMAACVRCRPSSGVAIAALALHAGVGGSIPSPPTPGKPC